jgi:drug/metabolite transporter (DMT)-like permease
LHDSIPPFTLSFLRWFVAFIVIAPFAVKYFIKDFHVIKSNYKYIFVTSITGITLFNTLIYIAGHSTDAINLSLIAITSPVFIIILSLIFYNEKINFLNAVGIILTLSGVVMLICKGSLEVLLNVSFSKGDIWMLSASIIFAVYSLLLKIKPQGIGVMSFLFSTFGLGLIMLIPFLLYDLNSSTPISLNFTTIMAVLYIGIFASIGGYFMWSKAVEFIGASKSGIIYYSLPLFSTLWAILLLGEKVQAIHFICMALIVTGIYVATKKK